MKPKRARDIRLGLILSVEYMQYHYSDRDSAKRVLRRAAKTGNVTYTTFIECCLRALARKH